jgi:hypothetical protein
MSRVKQHHSIQERGYSEDLMLSLFFNAMQVLFLGHSTFIADILRAK